MTIYPILGEEMRERFLLSSQMAEYKSDKVLTLESVPVKVRISIWWRVKEIQVYYYKISDNLSNRGDAYIHKMAESSLRNIFSSLSIASLAPTKENAFNNIDIKLPSVVHLTADKDIHSVHERLRSEILSSMQSSAAEYGISVDKVEIQEIELQKEIQDALNRIWKASLTPAQTQQEVRAREIELQSEASILGPNVMSLIEIMKQIAPHNTFSNTALGVSDLMSGIGMNSKSNDNPHVVLPSRLIKPYINIKKGDIYDGTVSEIGHLGATIELWPGCVGLLAYSEIDNPYSKPIGEYFMVGERVKVKVIRIAEEGIYLSQKSFR